MPTWPPRACTAGRAATGNCCRSCCAPALRHRCAAVNRWKMIDNLRRSLVAPASLALLALALATDAFAAALGARWLVAAALIARPADGRAGRPGAEPRRRSRCATSSTSALTDLLRALAGAAWQFAQLLQRRRWLLLDAIAARALAHGGEPAPSARMDHRGRRRRRRRSYRLGAPSCAALARPLQRCVLLALAVAALRHARTRWLGVLLFVLWALAPVWAWWVSRPRPAARRRARRRRTAPTSKTLARDTWRLFEHCVGADDNHLPPDNLQLEPRATRSRTAPRRPTSACTCWRAAARASSAGSTPRRSPRGSRRRSTRSTACRAPRPLPQLVRHADAARCCRRPTCRASTAATSRGHLLAVAQACRELARPTAAAPTRGSCEALAQRCEAPVRRHGLPRPLRPQAAPVPHRPARRRATARRELLRPARLRVAPDQLPRHRQGRRAAAPLGGARPAVPRGRRAAGPEVVVGLDVRVPDADAGDGRAGTAACCTVASLRGACASSRPSARAARCPGASRSRPTSRRTTRWPTSTRRYGVPRLALRRTPPTTAWSRPMPPRWPRMLAPRRRGGQPARCSKRCGARGELGFIDALDFTAGAPARGPGASPW